MTKTFLSSYMTPVHLLSLSSIDFDRFLLVIVLSFPLLDLRFFFFFFFDFLHLHPRTMVFQQINVINETHSTMLLLLFLTRGDKYVGQKQERISQEIE